MKNGRGEQLEHGRQQAPYSVEARCESWRWGEWSALGNKKALTRRAGDGLEGCEGEGVGRWIGYRGNVCIPIRIPAVCINFSLSVSIVSAK